MSNWESTTWGEVATLEYGKTLRNYEQSNGQFRVFGTNGPIGWTDQALYDKPTIVLGRKGAYRGVHYSHLPCYVIDTAFYLKPKREIDIRWAYYAMLTLDINGMDSGSAIPSTSRDDFYRLPLLLPPLVQQRQIAGILATLDDKIELNRRMSQTLEGIARALFKSWFVDFDPVHAKAAGREPVGMDAEMAALFPSEFEESELGLIPKGWRIDPLSEVLEALETGSRPMGGVSNYTSGVPSVGAESIQGLGIFDYSKTKYVPDEYFQQMNRGRVQDGDVLLYKDGGRPGEFEPHVTMAGYGFPFEAFAINEHVYRIRAKSAFGQSLLYFWLTSPYVMEQMRRRGTGVAIPGLNSTQVKSLPTLIPAPAICQAFDITAEPFVRRIFFACTESVTLASSRDALLPRLVSGDLSGWSESAEGSPA